MVFDFWCGDIAGTLANELFCHSTRAGETSSNMFCTTCTSKYVAPGVVLRELDAVRSDVWFWVRVVVQFFGVILPKHVHSNVESFNALRIAVVEFSFSFGAMFPARMWDRACHESCPYRSRRVRDVPRRKFPGKWTA